MTQKSIDVKKAAHLQPGLRFPARSLNYLFDDTGHFLSPRGGVGGFSSVVCHNKIYSPPPPALSFFYNPLSLVVSL